MVQQATPIAEAEATSTVAEPTLDELNAPLVEPEEAAEITEGEQGLVQQAEEAAAPEAEGAAEDTRATTEPAPEEAEAAVATISRQEHEAELAKVRSGLDKRASDLERQMQQLRADTAQREAQYQQQLSAQNYAAQVAAYEQKLATEYENQGYTEADAQKIAAAQTRQIETAYKYALENQRLQEQLKVRTDSENQTNSRIAARDLAAEHGVSEDDIPLLMKQPDPETMKAAAVRLGALNKQAQELTQQRRASVPRGANTDLDESGGGDGPMTDMEKIRAFGNGTYDNATEVYGLMRKHGMM